MRKVIVSLSSDSIAARECLIGIFNYINCGHDWQVSLLPSPKYITPAVILSAQRDGVEGILTGTGRCTDGFIAAVNSGIPMSLINTPSNWAPQQGKPVAIVHNDDQKVGRLAAKHLRHAGKFRSYAYIPSENKTFWSTHRRRGFQSMLLEFGILPAIYGHQEEDLAGWISALPKPTAIFAVEDRLAIRVIEVCKDLKLRIPQQVAVIGVDNDTLYCDNARPTLSSIHPNHVELGWRAAEELDRLMNHQPVPSTSFVSPIGVIVRESTRVIPPAAHLIQNALDFIQSHYQEGIGVKDVAKHLHVSESLLRLRFRETHGKSLRDALLDIRLAAVQKKLVRTQTPIAEIARQCGFSSTSHLSHFFQSRLGHPPSHYRHR